MYVHGGEEGAGSRHVPTSHHDDAGHGERDAVSSEQEASLPWLQEFHFRLLYLGERTFCHAREVGGHVFQAGDARDEGFDDEQVDQQGDHCGHLIS
jgi:hypothetical protein